MAETPESAASPAIPVSSGHGGGGDGGAGRVTRVGLVGLGRMGRNLVRLLHAGDNPRLEAVSDASSPATAAYLLRFDTHLGRFPAPIAVDGDALVVAGRRVRYFGAKQPGEIPWGELGIDTVIDTGEGRGAGRGRAEIERHLAAGARRVFLCVPPAAGQSGADITVAAGVNDDRLRREHRVVGWAGAAVQAAAPIARVLQDAFGVRRAFLTTVQAFTDDEHLADVPADQPRRGRAAAENIIPRETHVADAIVDLLPELGGKLTGFAMNVPVSDGSVADLVCWHERPATVEEVNHAVREASASRLRGIVEVEDSAIVSSDVLRTGPSGTFDSLATMAMAGNVTKTLTWFDNGWGSARQLIAVVRRFQEIDARESGGAEEARS